MKKKEVMEKYNLHRSLFGRLVQANYIKYVSRDNYEVDEELMKDFNAEEFDKQRKEALTDKSTLKR